MAKDIKKLRFLRENSDVVRKDISTGSFNRSRSTEIAQLFLNLKKNFTEKAMTNILKWKIYRKPSKFNKNTALVNSFVKYVVQNGGGCPVIPREMLTYEYA